MYLTTTTSSLLSGGGDDGGSSQSGEEVPRSKKRAVGAALVHTNRNDSDHRAGGGGSGSHNSTDNYHSRSLGHSSAGKSLAMKEPELPEVPKVDKPVVRNVLYTIWALNANSDPCVGWQVGRRCWQNPKPCLG